MEYRLASLIFAVTAMTGGIGMTALFEALTGNLKSAPLLNQWLERGVLLTLALLALVAGSRPFGDVDRST